MLTKFFFVAEPLKVPDSCRHSQRQQLDHKKEQRDLTAPIDGHSEQSNRRIFVEFLERAADGLLNTELDVSGAIS